MNRVCPIAAASLLVALTACGGSTTNSPVAPTPAPTDSSVTPHFVVTGVTREGQPASRALAGVRLTITSGPETGASVLSDSAGLFRFPSISATRVSMEATKDGYLSWQTTNLIAGDLQIDVVLFPTPPANAAGETATARCKDSTWTWSRTIVDACVNNGGIAYGVCPGPLCDAPLAGR